MIHLQTRANKCIGMNVCILYTQEYCPSPTVLSFWKEVGDVRTSTWASYDGSIRTRVVALRRTTQQHPQPTLLIYNNKNV